MQENTIYKKIHLEETNKTKKKNNEQTETKYELAMWKHEKNIGHIS